MEFEVSIDISNLPGLAFVNNVLDGDVVSLWDKPLHHLDEVGVGGQKGQSVMGMGPVSDTKAHHPPFVSIEDTNTHSFRMRTLPITHIQ